MEQFISMNRDIDAGKDLPRELLTVRSYVCERVYIWEWCNGYVPRCTCVLLFIVLLNGGEGGCGGHAGCVAEVTFTLNTIAIL